MADPKVQQDLAFVQNGQSSYSLNCSQAGVSEAKRVSDYMGFSFAVDWTGSAKGSLQVQVCNAGESKGLIVGTPKWTTIGDTAQLDIGGADSTPSFIEMSSSRAGWTRLIWTPASGSSGTLTTQFDGVRR